MPSKPATRIPAPRPERVTVARNPKATHDFHVIDTLEAGIVLTGTEVKSVRGRGVSIKGAFARLARGEVWVEGMNISPYEQGNRYNHDPIRSRKLLLHRREIEKLIGAVEREGLALVPLEVCFVRGRAKVLLALAKGKKDHDKREDLKKREAQRDISRAMAWRGRQ